MNHVSFFANMEILNERFALLKQEIFSHIPMTFSVDARENSADFFHVEEKKEGIFASFSNVRTSLYGAKKIASSLALQEKDFLGAFKAKFPWRVIAAEGVDLAPALELGINAALLYPKDVQKACGLKVILRVLIPEELKKISPFDPRYREVLQNIIKELPPHDAIYWESPYFERDCTDWLLTHFKLRYELFLEEIKALEGFSTLFYALPFKPAEFEMRHIKTFERHLGPFTYLVYSALDGDPALSFLPQSPYLTRGLPYFSGREEGDIGFDREGVQRLLDSSCMGAFLHIKAPFDFNGIQGCNLFLFTEALWQGRAPEASLARWWALQRRDLPFLRYKEILHKLSSFLPKRDFIRAKVANREDQKLHSDLLLGEIKLFEKAWELEKKKGQKSSSEQLFVNEVELYLSNIKKMVFES